MAGAFSDYLEAAILNWTKGTAMPTAPASVYVGLLTALPSDTGGGAATEVSGGSYARVAVAFGAVSTNGTAQQIVNSGAVNFPTPSAGWGTVVGFGIFDASTAGNLLYYGTQAPNKTINSGDSVSYASGAITVSLD